MAVSKWKYAKNQFLRVSSGRRPRLLTIGADHTAKLHAKLGSPPDPDIQICINRGQPLFDDFQLKMVIYDVRSGTRKGQTEMLDNLLEELVVQRLPAWDGTVLANYVPTTPQYTQIFPDGRAPFRSGSKELRIMAVQTLAVRLAAFPEFATLKTSVETFHASLTSARDTQQGTEGEIKSASDAAELARIQLAIGLYANMARLMEKHAAEPWKIEEYFELALLRVSGGGSATPPPDTEEELAVFVFNWIVSGSGVLLWFEMPADVPGVTSISMREGIVEQTAGVVLDPGQRQQVQWPSVTIDGEVDEVVLRDADDNIVAVGQRDETLPDPGP